MATIGELNSKIDFLNRTLSGVSKDNPAYKAVQNQIDECVDKVQRIFAAHGLTALTQEQIEASWDGIESTIEDDDDI